MLILFKLFVCLGLKSAELLLIHPAAWIRRKRSRHHNIRVAHFFEYFGRKNRSWYIPWLPCTKEAPLSYGFAGRMYRFPKQPAK